MHKRPTLIEQPVIKAMTRVPTIGGVTYSYWAMMLLISTGGIVILKSFLWAIGLLAICYVLGRMIARYDIFLMDIIVTKLSECPSTRNDNYWGCKSYEPW
jgi:type IV secretory pathway VirB3-like protein